MKNLQWEKITVGVYEAQLPENQYGFVRARTRGANPEALFGYGDGAQFTVLLYKAGASPFCFTTATLKWVEENLLT